jgi:hypothetical protein
VVSAVSACPRSTFDIGMEPIDALGQPGDADALGNLDAGQ